MSQFRVVFYIGHADVLQQSQDSKLLHTDLLKLWLSLNY